MRCLCGFAHQLFVICRGSAGRYYHTPCTPNCSNNRSLLIKARFSIWDCAINILSKGSRCSPGNNPACLACSADMDNKSKSCSLTTSTNRSATSIAPGNLPIRTLVAISHADTALTRTTLFSLAMKERAVRDSRSSPSSHHNSA